MLPIEAKTVFLDPDVASRPLGWMTVDDLLAMFDRYLLDAQALAQAESARDELADVRWGPFTQQTHEEIYSYCIGEARRLSPKTPVSVCHGTGATWEALGGMMQMTPESYICNCGPLSAPGGALYDRWNGEGGGPQCRATSPSLPPYPKRAPAPAGSTTRTP